MRSGLAGNFPANPLRGPTEGEDCVPLVSGHVFAVIRHFIVRRPNLIGTQRHNGRTRQVVDEPDLRAGAVPHLFHVAFHPMSDVGPFFLGDAFYLFLRHGAFVLPCLVKVELRFHREPVADLGRFERQIVMAVDSEGRHVIAELTDLMDRQTAFQQKFVVGFVKGKRQDRFIVGDYKGETRAAFHRENRTAENDVEQRVQVVTEPHFHP